MTEVNVRKLDDEDWPQVREIYAADIAAGATFETCPPSPEWVQFAES